MKTGSARRGGSKGGGSALRAGWNLAAKGVGGLARTVGRTRELEPEHRRDGLALGLIALALITAVGVLWAGAGPVGDVVAIGMRSVFGAGSVAVPLALVVVAVALMRSEQNPDTRPRRVIGTLLMTLSVLGLLHLINARPQTHDGQMYAGGWLGWFSGDLLARGVTVWVATPLLVLALTFGVLVFTGTPVRDIPRRLSEWGTDPDERGDFDYDESGQFDYDEADYHSPRGRRGARGGGAEVEGDPAAVRLRKPSRRRQSTAGEPGVESTLDDMLEPEAETASAAAAGTAGAGKSAASKATAKAAKAAQNADADARRARNRHCRSPAPSRATISCRRRSC
ncbi:hypothetical protein BJF85_19400 [Saccharomonospora sp. CUA-673]|nr:hypothetical protein BJF85_19400 [Saccharomonospora sp. CUA-673]